MAPSLLNEEATDPNDGFEEAVTRILDGNNGLSLRPDASDATVEDFAIVLKVGRILDDVDRWNRIS